VSTKPVKVGIVGLGRWAKVLTKASRASDKVEIALGFSRSEDKRQAFSRELGVPTASDLKTMLTDPEIRGVLLTVPNEQHLPLAREVAMAKKHVYTEKPIAATLARFSHTNFATARGFRKRRAGDLRTNFGVAPGDAGSLESLPVLRVQRGRGSSSGPSDDAA
jgi:pyrroline-5-carboxylate reductase